MSGRKRDLKVKDKIKEIEELNPILPGIGNLGNTCFANSVL